MKKKLIGILLGAMILAGCGSKTEPQSSGMNDVTQAVTEAVGQASDSGTETATASKTTETIGEISFDISTLWTKEEMDEGVAYLRTLSDGKSYEAFMFVMYKTIDYSKFSSVKEALVSVSDDSVIDGAEVSFTRSVKLNGVDCLQNEQIAKQDNGEMITEMYFIPGPTTVTLISCSELRDNEVDYSSEFSEILKTVRVNGTAPSLSSGSGTTATTSKEALYDQSDYILRCHEQNNGTVGCDAMLEITNVGNVPIYLNEGAYFDIYNESGSIIAHCTQGNIDLIPEVILPGERGYYVTIDPIELPGGYFTGYNYELGGEIFPAKADVTLHDYPVEVISINEDDGGRPGVLGYVTNDTNHTYPNIQLYAIYYDNEGRPEGAAHDYLGKLEPGKRSPFSLGGKLTQKTASFSLVSDYEVIGREAYNPD